MCRISECRRSSHEGEWREEEEEKGDARLIAFHLHSILGGEEVGKMIDTDIKRYYLLCISSFLPFWKRWYQPRRRSERRGEERVACLFWWCTVRRWLILKEEISEIL